MPVVHLNDHEMYYEVHGTGDPVLCMGGWGTYCHGGTNNLARGLTDGYQVIIFDYRGIGESTDDPTVPATMALHAADAIARHRNGAEFLPVGARCVAGERNAFRHVGTPPSGVHSRA